MIDRLRNSKNSKLSLVLWILWHSNHERRTQTNGNSPRSKSQQIFLQHKAVKHYLNSSINRIASITRKIW